MFRRIVGVLVGAVLLVGGAAGAATGAVGSPSWPQAGFDPGGSNFNPAETTITTANVAALTQSWRARGRDFVSADGMLFTTRPNKLAAYSIAACAQAGGSCTPAWIATGSFGDELAFSGGVLYATRRDRAGNAGLAAYDASGVTNCAGSPVVCTPLWKWVDRSSSTLTFVGYPKIGDGRLWVVDVQSQNMNVVAAHLRAFDIVHHTGCAGTSCRPVLSIAAPDTGFSYSLGHRQVVIAGEPGAVRVYNARTGAQEWRAAKRGYDATVVAQNGMIYVANQSRAEVEAYPADGGASCSGSGASTVCAAAFVAPYTAQNPPTLAVTSSRLFVDDHHDVRAYDAAGVTNCSRSVPAVCVPLTSYLGAGGNSAPTVAGGVLYAANATSVRAYDAAGSVGCDHDMQTCSPLWSTAPESIVGSAIEVAGGMLATTSQNDGSVHVYVLAD